MNKAEKLIKQHPILGIALLILIMIEVLKLFVLVWILQLLTMDITCEEMAALGLIILDVCLTDCHVDYTITINVHLFKTYWLNV